MWPPALDGVHAPPLQTITSLEKQLAEVKGQLQESQFKSKSELNELKRKCTVEMQTLVKSHETSVCLLVNMYITYLHMFIFAHVHICTCSYLHTDCKTKSATRVPEKFNCRET